MTAPELVFLHIPKTAGTSQHRLFNKHCGRENVFWIGQDCAPNIHLYPAAEVGSRRLVGGHKPLSFYPRTHDPLYCALLRNPIERAVSLFVYYTRPELAVAEHDQKTRADILQQLRKQGIDPDSMYASITNCRTFRREISNYQCSYLSRNRATFSGVRKSLRTLDCIIGTVDASDRFHAALAELLGWPDEAPARLNRSKDNYAARYLDDEELVALVQELNTEDQKLVDWVRTEHGGLWQKFADLRQRRARLRMIPRAPAPPERSRPSLDTAADLWPPARTAQLPGPLGRIMVAESPKLLYMPVPGHLDQQLQHMMLRLSSIEHKEVALELGLGRVVERFATGLLLRDRSRSEIMAIAASNAFFKFAFLYEPVARLVDVFVQRFVLMRSSLPRWPGLYALVADVQGRPEPDCDSAISFRQLVTAITATGGKHKHPLWLPQSRVLLDPDSFDRIYLEDQVAELQRDLARLRGLSIDLENAATAVGRPPAVVATWSPDTAEFADTVAAQLPADPSLWRDRLVDEAIDKMLQGYYARDFSLYNRIAADERKRESG